ncbi:MAG: (2Fe-2S) ferredoxin domain-containing protein [Synechococcales bacterium]|nr:(2Fe-2S) ferredoxin domain-containing protein [Synechococcales bacterium]
MTNPASHPPTHPSTPPSRRCVLVCQHRSCQRNGSEAVLAAFKATPVANVFVSGSDCTGQCSSGPTVRVMPDGTWYCRVKPEDVVTIVDEHLKGDRPVQSLLHPRLHPRFDAM